MTFGYKNKPQNAFGDPLPEKRPKILNTYKYFRVFVHEKYAQEMKEGLPIIPLVRDMIGSSNKKEALKKEYVAIGEMITYLRYEARFDQYIFVTQDSVEFILPEGLINSKFLFPINKS